MVNTDNAKWISAISYFLVLLIVISGYFLENYNLNFFGVQLNFFTLIPYLIYYFINRKHKIEFIALHTKKSMRIFLGYVFSMISIGIIMGFGMLAGVLIIPDVLFESNALILMYIIPLLFVVIPTILVTTLGMIRSLKFISPYNFR